MKQQLRFSNCFIECIKLKLRYPRGTIGHDFNSPSGKISFFFILDGKEYRFRRKIMRRGNKSALLFKGYRVITEL